MNDNSIKILLIEDNPGDSRLIQEMLAEYKSVSYNFKSVDRLSIGLETIAREKSDVILLDLGLPDSQGLETLKRIRNKFPGTPTVVLTGLDSKELGIEAVHEGAQDYLVKGKMDNSEALWRIIQYAMERSRSEHKLHDSEARLKEAQALGKIGSWEFDISTNIIEWSDQVYELFERDKALGPPSLEEESGYYPPEETARLREFARQAIEKGEQFNYDLQATLPSGKTVFFNAWLHPVKNVEGQVIKLFGTVQDITERKRSEEVLSNSEVRYRRLFEAAKDGILILDADTGQVVDANPFLLTKLGYSSKEIVGRAIWELGFLKDVIANKAKFAELQQNEYVHYKDLPMETSNGQSLEVEFVSNVYMVDHTKVIQCNIRDITEFKRLEAEQRRVTRLESVGILAGGIAHDFNNILTAIVGNISLAKMKTKPESDLYDNLEKAEKASLRAKDLTQQLLTFSKGGAPIKKLASLSDLLRDTASFAISGSNINCQFSIPADLCHAKIDEGQISQVINNLVINARQAMPAGGMIEVHAENITLTEETSLPLEQGKYIRIAVIDNGIGIKTAHLDKIFDPFFTTKQTGSGLGLATSFSIVRNHGGYLCVESKPDIGSTFYIYLPASEKTANTAMIESKQTPIGGIARILVMDDEESVRDVAGEMLKYIGIKDIEFATNGNDAIKLFTEAMNTGKPFDLVILDLTIPGGMGGKETIKELRKLNPKIKAVVSSGYSSESAISEYKEFGFNGAVNKPYTIEQLKKTLCEVIG